MPNDDLRAWSHDHRFDQGNEAGERGARAVMWITALMMVVEIAAGWWFNSMALLADGWHMSSHALAIGLSAFAYAAARRHAGDERFAFGTWKIEVLAGFASAIVLLGVAAVMTFVSVERFVTPQPIHYVEAIVVAVMGLAVNIGCALILGTAHHQDGDGHHAHSDHHHHHDLNLKSAYLHVIADAATSVLAIAALTGGWLWGWSWLDPVMGIVGAVLVALWARGLLRDTGKVLLDREMDHPLVTAIRDTIAAHRSPGETRLTDLHVWRVGKRSYACALSVVTLDRTLTSARVRDWLAGHDKIAHSTVEVTQCG